MTTAAIVRSAGDWEPVGVFAALVFLAVGSDLLAFRVRGLHLSGSFAAIILAAVLLGPAPAVIVGLAPIIVSSFRERAALQGLISNLAVYATFPIVAALCGRGDWHLIDLDDLAHGRRVAGDLRRRQLAEFRPDHTPHWLCEGWSWRKGFHDMFWPVLPAQLGIGLVTVAVVYAERYVGAKAIMLFAPTILVFQWLLRTAIFAYERGEQLEERNQQLAALQFGLISTTMKTLALRDHMTARHSAAVARYAREMAGELGLGADEQELFHTAGLFHDIGKFIFPDSILLASKGLTDEEFAIVRRHPEVGADLIAEIDGYGPVADIVRHHHERIDGRGYPFGIHGDLIPLGSRVIAVADVYDVLTARDTYRDPVSTNEAFDELRRCAGTQLDARLVEVFIELVSRRGLMFSHSSSEDFEAELALERRVSDYAAPRVAA